MLDLQTDPFIFRSHSMREIRSELMQALPNAVVVCKEGKKPGIEIRNGIWRGARLGIREDLQTIQLTQIDLKLSNLFRSVIVIFSITIVLSVIATIYLSVALGKVTWEFVGLGAIPAVILGTSVENIIVRRVNKTWSVELGQILERLKASGQILESLAAQGEEQKYEERTIKGEAETKKWPQGTETILQDGVENEAADILETISPPLGVSLYLLGCWLISTASDAGNFGASVFMVAIGLSAISITFYLLYVR